jgi:(2Fe-2S) ferredoxin
MAAFERHVLVCTNAREPGHPRGCCSAKDSPAIRERLKAEIERRGLKRRIRINQAGCLDQCEHGVTIVVYPEAVWYGFVKIEDVPELVEQHLVGGRPVERLRLPPNCINTERCAHRGGATIPIGLGMPPK